MSRYQEYWASYVSVAERKRNAEKEIASLKKKGKKISPVQIEGRTITKTFWGKSWCDNLEGYSDFENRLPRGRTYVRNGSVIDLQISKGKIIATVNGSSFYAIEISISAFDKKRWQSLIKECSGQIDSLIELLQGRFSKGVMEVMTCRKRGLFPSPKEIEMSCSCPDSAYLCKHIAAVMYGVGARLDESPELLFLLRNLDHTELMGSAVAVTAGVRARQPKKVLKSTDLSSIFGVDLEADEKPLKTRAVKRTGKKAR